MSEILNDAAEGKLMLHPEKGMNPRRTICARCNAPTPEILLLGVHDQWDECDRCDRQYIGDPKAARACCGTGKLNSKGSHPVNLPVPGAICETCENEMQQFDEVVKAGGLYFQCIDCGKAGVIKRNDWTLAFKKEMKMEEDEVAGVEFTQDDCPHCKATVPGGGEL